MSEQAFKRYNSSKDKFEGKFLLSAFETISVGLGRNYLEYCELPLDANLKKVITEKIIQIWSHETYQAKSGSGVRANFRIPVIVPLGQKIFKYED